MEDIKSIEIVFENCECVEIKSKDITYIIIKDLNQEIKRVACNSISKTQYADYIGIIISNRAKIKTSFGPMMDENYNERDRLINSQDITSIYLNYGKGKTEAIFADWQDNGNEWTNKNQKIFEDKDGYIYICLGENLKEIENNLKLIAEDVKPFNKIDFFD